MGRLGNFLRLPTAQRRLILQVTLLLRATQLALRLFPFRRVYQWMKNASQPAARQGKKGIVDAGLICATVNKSGRYFLGMDSCFPQALVGEMLLERNGHPAAIADWGDQTAWWGPESSRLGGAKRRGCDRGADLPRGKIHTTT